MAWRPKSVLYPETEHVTDINIRYVYICIHLQATETKTSNISGSWSLLQDGWHHLIFSKNLMYYSRTMPRIGSVCLHFFSGILTLELCASWTDLVLLLLVYCYRICVGYFFKVLGPALLRDYSGRVTHAWTPTELTEVNMFYCFVPPGHFLCYYRNHSRRWYISLCFPLSPSSKEVPLVLTRAWLIKQVLYLLQKMFPLSTIIC